MPDPVIQVQNLSKRYTLTERQSYLALRDTITRLATAPFRAFKTQVKPSSPERTLWALRDINFQVHSGEVIGIVGRNGAGKSTLLKVLSQITEPTEGFADIRGRVGSLLEVGTGFHPELTGRENIYLNGAILGMRRQEILRKFDEIVAFAEVEQFLDTTVKHYSSGMYMRLAFSVAAHLEPEILILDEVLAVGDAQFQKKCFGKMSDVAAQGRTVLFVSHNLAAVRRLCNRALLMERGHLLQDGPVEHVLQRYNTEVARNACVYEQPEDTRKGANLRRAAVLNQAGESVSEIEYRDGCRIQVEYEIHKPVSDCIVWISIWTADGSMLFTSCDYDTSPELLAPRTPGYYRTQVAIPPDFLNTGRYNVVVAVTSQSPVFNYDRVEALQFAVVDSNKYPLIERTCRTGILKPILPWQTQRL